MTTHAQGRADRQGDQPCPGRQGHRRPAPRPGRRAGARLLPPRRARGPPRPQRRGRVRRVRGPLQARPSRPQGTAQVRVATPTLAEHGWSASGHSVVEVVVDDMPFLVDSLTMELSRQLRDVHVVIHPSFDAVRDITGALQSVRSVPDGALDPRARRSASRGCTSRSTGCPRATTPTRSSTTSSGCCATSARPSRTGSKMHAEVDAIVADLRSDPPPLDPEEVRQAAELLEWLANEHFTFLGYREYRLEERDGDDYLLRGPRDRPGHPPRRPGDVGVVRPAARRGEGEGAREDAAGARQGQLPRDRAPPGVPRLRRRQDLRRERRGERRAPLPRPARQRGLHRVA